MGIAELFIAAVGLSMDAFAVSVCKGLAMEKAGPRQMLTVGLWFGFFQAAMPLIGYFLGARFAGSIGAYDHWIAFALLALIGAQMIRESRAGADEASQGGSLTPADMLPLAVATSIDALAVGISFAFLQVRIVPAVSVIGAVTLGMSAAGVKAGHLFGTRWKAKAELAGGVILIGLGLKILLEHWVLLG